MAIQRFYRNNDWEQILKSLHFDANTQYIKTVHIDTTAAGLIEVSGDVYLETMEFLNGESDQTSSQETLELAALLHEEPTLNVKIILDLERFKYEVEAETYKLLEFMQG